MARLVILHTADLHGRLGQRQAQRLSQERRERDALLLDSGDAVTAPNVFVWPWAERVLLRMNEAGYGAMALGNREFFFRCGGLTHKIGPARFPVLAANVQVQRRSPVQPHTWLETRQGDRVGVIGLAREMVRPGSWEERFCSVRFVPWREVLPRLVAELRQEATWLVVLSHLGPEADEEVARLCPELDLVLSGHSHTPQGTVRRIGQTTIVRTAPYLRELQLIRSRSEASPSEFEVEAVAL